MDDLIEIIKASKLRQKLEKLRVKMDEEKHIITRKCFCCEKPLKGAMDNGRKQKFSEPPSGATVWHTSGNYGSTVYDNGWDNSSQLEIAICDECLVMKAKLVVEFRMGYRPVSSVSPFKVHKPKKVKTPK